MHNLLIVLASFLASAVEMVEAAHDRARRRRHSRMAVGRLGRRSRARCARGHRRRARPRARAAADRHVAPRRRHAAPALRAPVAAQGDPASERSEGAARRGRDLSRPRSRSSRRRGARPGHDWYAFTVAFKGVFLEGLEVAFIVVTFGGTQRNVGLAAIGAARRTGRGAHRRGDRPRARSRGCPRTR